MRRLVLVGCGLILAGAAPPQTPPPTPPSPPPSIASLIARTAGRWQGELQYRDYESNTWEGLPVKVSIVAQPDGVTMVRTAEFDDGPRVGAVWITTLSTIDPATGKESYAAARKGKPFESGSTQLTLAAPPHDATHWTIVATDTRNDGNGPARIRETTVRDGTRLTTQKDVDPLDDGKDEWLPRNRTALTMVE